MKSKKILVIYHGNCPDGFAGAWAAYKKLGNRAEYVGVEDRRVLPKNAKGKEIYLIDLVYPKELLKKLIKENKRVVAIDHHITAKDSMMLVSEGLFALDHSGAVLSWLYFHPQKKVPQFLRHIEDFDLWKFKLAGTKELRAFLDSKTWSFKLCDELAGNMESVSKTNVYLEKGKAILEYQEKVVEDLALRNSEYVSFAGYKTLVLNSPVLQSQIGNALTKKKPPIGIVWNEHDGRIFVSLRSNGAVDVSKIAQKFGGGGHKAASGFSFGTGKKFPWKRNPLSSLRKRGSKI